MKKLLFALVCALFTINVFADGLSCKVANGGGKTVTLPNATWQSDSQGYIKIPVNLSEALLYGRIFVQVNVYDSKTGDYVNTETIEFNNKSGRSSAVSFRGYKTNYPYYYRINQATCE